MVQFIYRDVRKLETFRDSRFSVLVSPSEPVPTFVGLSLEVFFTPNRNQFISLGLGLSYFFFGSVPTKMYRESFHCGQFEAEQPKRYHNCFLTRKRYGQIAVLFIWDSPLLCPVKAHVLRVKYAGS